MSRHSKNCTASSVFTYAEKKKLTDYGVISTRVGTDSQRQFEMCYICLNFAVEPMACLNGHLFCKECIVEYLVTQKKEYKLALKEWTRLKKEFERKEAQEQSKLQAIENSKYEVRIPVSISKEENPGSQNELAVQQMKDFRAGKIQLSKEESKKFNFWLPENQIMKPENLGPKPSKNCRCPADLNHFIKFKDIVLLRIAKDEKSFLCLSCKKELKFQKAKLSRVCGHVFCLSCFQNICKGECGVCSQKFLHDQIVALKPGGSGYSSHNPVEAVKYNPIFN